MKYGYANNDKYIKKNNQFIKIFIIKASQWSKKMKSRIKASNEIPKTNKYSIIIKKAKKIIIMHLKTILKHLKNI